MGRMYRGGFVSDEEYQRLEQIDRDEAEQVRRSQIVAEENAKNTPDESGDPVLTKGQKIAATRAANKAAAEAALAEAQAALAEAESDETETSQDAAPDVASDAQTTTPQEDDQ